MEKSCDGVEYNTSRLFRNDGEIPKSPNDGFFPLSNKLYPEYVEYIGFQQEEKQEVNCLNELCSYRNRNSLSSFRADERRISAAFFSLPFP